MPRTRTLPSTLLITTMAATAVAAIASGPALAAATQCAAPAVAQTFEMAYIDETRAGGEPIVTKHPDGQLLWGSHAGTTHFYSPTAPSAGTVPFVQNYEGQTYYYVSDDTETWDYVPRTPVQSALAVQVPSVGVPMTGFSDPEFAIESDGTVYVSEINLANVAVSKSEDGGHSYDLVNVFSFTSSDRQWMAADGDGELYMTANGFGGGSFPASAVGNLGHFMAKSTDGGLTWGEASTTNTSGVGDIQIDHERGILYEMSEAGGTISIARFPKIRTESTDFTVERFPIASGLGLTGVQRLIGPTFDMDEDGNLYAVWEHNGSSTVQPGIYYAASTDQGETWSEPVRVDVGELDDIWPWISVGDAGQVAITWLQSNKATNATLAGEAGGNDTKWNVMVAHTDSGIGCADADLASFSVVQASSEPIHTGTVCQHGTTCQADLTDRRLGDYHTIEVDGSGMVHVAVSDTRRGGAVSLPLHIRQTSGPVLVASEGAAAPLAIPTGGGSEGALVAAADSVLAATGGGAALIGVGLVGLAFAGRRRRD